MLSLFFWPPIPFSHLLPLINLLPSENLLIVSKHEFVQPLHLVIEVVYVNSSNCLRFNIVVGSPLYLSLAIRAAPKAPIIPAMSGLIAWMWATFSKLLKTASL